MLRKRQFDFLRLALVRNIVNSYLGVVNILTGNLAGRCYTLSGDICYFRRDILFYCCIALLADDVSGRARKVILRGSIPGEYSLWLMLAALSQIPLIGFLINFIIHALLFGFIFLVEMFIDIVLLHGRFHARIVSVLINHVLDGVFIELLAQLRYDSIIDLVVEHLRELVCIILIDDVINIIIMLRLLRAVWRFHQFLIILDGAAFVRVRIHDVGHIEGVILSQPTVQNQQLLCLGLSPGGFHHFESLLLGGQNGFTIILGAKRVGISKVLDHADQIIIAVIAVSDRVHGRTRQNQHLAQNAQTIFLVVIKLQEERCLNTVNIGVIRHNLLVLAVQIQNCLDLLLRQSNRLAVLIEHGDVLQFLTDNDNFAVVFIDLRVLGNFDIAGAHAGDINLVRVELECEVAVRHGKNGSFLLRLFRSLCGGGRVLCSFGCGSRVSCSFDRCRRLFGFRCSRREYQQAEHHGKNQQHTQETSCCLFHFTVFLSLFVVRSHPGSIPDGYR